MTVEDLVDHFLTAKEYQRDSGELSSRFYTELRATCDLIVAQFSLHRMVDDLAAPDFEALRATMARRWGPTRLGNEVQRVRSVFKYGYEAGLIDRPMRFGPQFKRPKKSIMRKHKAQSGPKMFTAEELCDLIDGRLVPGDHGPELVKPVNQLRAMILLGLNCGLGNTDCASLKLNHLDLATGWLDFPRPKTGIPRRCPLWPETVEALRAVEAERGKPAGYDACGLVFVNERGSPWVHVRKTCRTDNVTIQFRFLLRRLGIHRLGVGFYTLRHVFRTIADSARDPVAIDLIMGHADHTMGGHYRERIDDARLVAVTEVVRKWLFGKAVQQ